MIKRICLYAGPGGGKSTMAARLFAQLKVDGRDVEHVNEYIKPWAYAGRFPKGLDQWLIFAKQLHREECLLRHVPLVITDSPVLMNVFYARKYNVPGWQHLVELARLYEEIYPGLHVYLHRNHPYQNEGRYQDEAQANEIGTEIQAFMREFLPATVRVYYDNRPYDELLQFIRDQSQP